MVALSLARATRDAGNEAAFFSPSDGPFIQLAASAGFETIIVPLRNALRFDDAVRLSRALRRERVDLVHTHAHFTVNVLGRVAGRLAGVPVISHMHAPNVFRQGRGRRTQIVLDNATACACARIVAVSEATRRALEEQGYPQRLLETVLNGIHLDEVLPRDQAVRSEFGVPQNAALIACVGRLTPTKGQIDLIRALPLLDDVYAVFAGIDLELDGRYEEELRAEADRVGVAGRAIFIGLRHDVPRVLAASDISAVPSRHEPFGMVALEAMAQRLPVVASAVDGLPEVVADGETGLLVPTQNPPALADAIRRLVADRATAKRLGMAGRKRAEMYFSAERMTNRVIEIYGEVTG